MQCRLYKNDSFETILQLSPKNNRDINTLKNQFLCNNKSHTVMSNNLLRQHSSLNQIIKTKRRIESAIITKSRNAHNIQFNTNSLNSIPNNITNSKHKAEMQNSKSIFDVFSKVNLSEAYKNEKQLIKQNKKIKAHFNKLLSQNTVMNYQIYKKHDEVFHHVESLRKKYETDKRMHKKTIERNKINQSLNKSNRSRSAKLHFRSHPELFSKERTYYKYEDEYISPPNFLNRNFSSKELEMLVTQPYYFQLYKKPFQGSNIKLYTNLCDKLNKEDERKPLTLLEDKANKWLFNEKIITYDLSQKTKHKTKNKTMVYYRNNNKKNKGQLHNKLSFTEYLTKKKNETIMAKVNESETIFSSFEYEKLFDFIEQRKEFFMLKRSNALKNKQAIFAELKKSNTEKRLKFENEIYNARKIVVDIEKNYLRPKASIKALSLSANQNMIQKQQRK